MSDIKIQPSATGSATVTLTAPTTGTARTVTLPDSTGTLVDDTTAVVKNSNGDVGIGVTPESDWRSNVTGLQIGNSGSIFARSDSGETKTFISENVKWTADAQEYINNGYASMHQMDAGIHSLQVAPSGTADAAITFTTGLEVLNDGKARAKNGLLFGTDTAAANALDDYEEGTWTAGLRGSTTAGNHTYHGRNGSYTKVGRAVHFRGDIHINAIGSIDGEIYVTGLPFTVGSNGIGCGATFTYAGGLQLSVVSSPVGYTNNNTTEFAIRVFDVVGGTTNLNQSELSSGCQVVFSGTYFI